MVVLDRIAAVLHVRLSAQQKIGILNYRILLTAFIVVKSFASFLLMHKINARFTIIIIMIARNK